MTEAIIRRCWRGNSLKKHPKIGRSVFDEILSDIEQGDVFPAVRENEIHLYHGGGRILRITPRTVKTHGRYNNTCNSGDDSLPDELTTDKYSDIKKRCKAHNGDELQTTHECQEGWIVSRLFPRYSYWSKCAEPDQPKLIDIEVRFRRTAGGGGEAKSDKVDLLFLEADGCLRFVEVKRQYDQRIRSAKGSPEVVCQIDRYNRAVEAGAKDIISAYGNVPSIFREALGLNAFSDPERVCLRVPVLVCRRDTKDWRDTKDGQDTWLREQLSRCRRNQIGNNLIVDGGGIGDGLYGDIEPPIWCPCGLWERLDMREVFRKIDEASSETTPGGREAPMNPASL